ncbi:MAG: hypothetical protein JXR52_01950 [Bacteroidales bacterium]|nr:hypothetical protein [Bacteroidales bacterium]MBN2697563.1 hypothetical protein [Bacteroidales bacterium]
MKRDYREWIEPYLEGTLPAEERLEFEEAMERDPRLREACALWTMMDDCETAAARFREMEESPEWHALDEKAEEAVKEFYREVHHVDLDTAIGKGGTKSQIPNHKFKKGSGSPSDSGAGAGRESRTAGPERFLQRKTVRWISGLAAGILIPLGLFFILTARPTVTPEQYAAYVEKVTDLAVTDRSVPTDIYRDLLSGIEQFETRDYDKALETFGRLSPQQERVPAISLFRGLVLLETGKRQPALDAFRDCARQPGPYRKYARWFGKVAYLRLLDPEAAILFFIEGSRFFRDLPEGMQHLIKAVNLINTGQWKAYRQMVNPGAEGPLVLKRDDIIAIAVILFLFLLTILSLIDIARMHLPRRDWMLFVMILLFMPGFGAIAYLLVFRRYAKNLKQDKT